MDFSKETFLRKLAPTSPSPFAITIERAEGVYLFSPDGKKYIDMISGIAVSNVGHRHPKIVEAIKNQVDKHLHVMVYGEYIQSPSNLLAEKLNSLLPPSLNCSYFLVERVTMEVRMVR
jgi:adenosylmethionine-8-amino-7-oxononanoate aminotransferase